MGEGEQDDRIARSDDEPVLNTDFYKHWGETITGGGQPSRPTEVADSQSAGRTEVTLKPGQTFWKLAEEKYNGQHPIEAIYAANGLTPKWVEKDGKKVLEDPKYYAGKTYVLPAESEIEALTKKYKDQVRELGQNGRERVGQPNEETPVQLIYGDTFWKLGKAKYDNMERPPIEAIYEANKMTPQVRDNNGKPELIDPTYYAGKTYVLPAAKDIEALTNRFWERLGYPEMSPYRGDRPRQEPTPPRDGRRPDEPYGQYGDPYLDRA
jgi:hypothetical protein